MGAALFADHRDADRLQRAAARAARQPAHRGAAARARRAGGAGAVPAVPARAGPAVGPAAGRLRRHDRALRHHDARATCRSLAQSDAIAFRAEFEGDAPPRAQRYWRGPVLWDFDGRTWSIGPTFLARLRAAARRARAYRYEVVLEPHNRHWLFALETAASLPERARMTYDGQLLSSDAGARAHALRADLGRSRRAPDAARRRRQRCAARCACRRASTRARARSPRSGAPPRPTTPRSWRARSPSCASGATSTRSSRRCSARHSVDEFLFDTKAGLLRALLLGLRVPDARRRRAGARGHRLPGRRAQPGRQHHHRAPVRRARLGRGVPRRPRLGARRPDRARRCPGASKPAWRARCRRPRRCR